MSQYLSTHVFRVIPATIGMTNLTNVLFVQLYLTPPAASARTMELSAQDALLTGGSSLRTTCSASSQFLIASPALRVSPVSSLLILHKASTNALVSQATTLIALSFSVFSAFQDASHALILKLVLPAIQVSWFLPVEQFVSLLLKIAIQLLTLLCPMVIMMMMRISGTAVTVILDFTEIPTISSASLARQ